LADIDRIVQGQAGTAVTVASCGIAYY